jgi:hypothetical protein
MIFFALLLAAFVTLWILWRIMDKAADALGWLFWWLRS